MPLDFHMTNWGTKDFLALCHGGIFIVDVVNNVDRLINILIFFAGCGFHYIGKDLKKKSPKGVERKRLQHHLYGEV